MPEGVLLIVTETGAAGLAGPGREAFGLASALAGLAGGAVSAAIFDAPESPAVREAAERGAARVFSLGARPATSAALVAASGAAVEAVNPRFVVTNRGAFVLDLVPRLAVRFAGGSVLGVTGLRQRDGEIQAEAAIFGGAARGIFRFKGEGVHVMSPAPGGAEPPERVAGRQADVTALTPPVIEDPVRVVEPIRAPEGPRLEDARVVVSGGRGLRSGENYALIRELAAALGGMPGASRAIVDDAWAKPAEQVGLTGKIVTPELYLAFGISGASQHMAGCSNSKVIIAVNTDPEAPIFRYAHVGVVENCLELLPELIRRARERSVAG